MGPKKDYKDIKTHSIVRHRLVGDSRNIPFTCIPFSRLLKLFNLPKFLKSNWYNMQSKHMQKQGRKLSIGT